MCSVMAAQIGLSTLSSVTNYIGANRQADQQDAYNRAVYEQQKAFAQANVEYQERLAQQQADYMVKTAENAMFSQRNSNEAIEARLAQEELASKVQLEQLRMERLKAVGALQAAERTGVSAQRLINDFYAQEGRYAAITQQNNKFLREQAVREKLAVQAQTQSRLNEARPYIPAPVNFPLPPTPASRPSLLGTAIQIGGGVLDAYNRYGAKNPYRGTFDQGSARIFDSYQDPNNTLPANAIKIPVGTEYIFEPPTQTAPRTDSPFTTPRWQREGWV